MLSHPTLDKLQTLRLSGMAKAFQEQQAIPDSQSLTFEERLGLLLDRELTERDSRALAARLQRAKLKQAATPEEIDFTAPRGLDRAAWLALLDSVWIKAHRNVLITGPTGVGKSFLACALAHQACRQGFSAGYARLPRWFPDLALAKADGRFPKLFAQYAKIDLLILDDFGLAPLNADARHGLLELLDDRHGRNSTLVTSQLPVALWHEALGDPTFADAILDRLVHNAYTFNLKGESLRKPRAPLTKREVSV